MRKHRNIILTLLVLYAGGVSCNLPDPSAQQNAPEIQTAAAQMVQAVLTPLSSPTAATNAAAGTQASAPLLTVPDATNCRTGPGTGFAKITTLPAGTSVPIVARDGGGTFWIVDPPDVSENCWVVAELGTVSGDVSTLPEVTPAAESSGGAPAKPTIQKWDFFCNGTGQTDVSLAWTDKASNEAGYRVYRNGVVVVELAANTTQYSETITLLSGQSAGYNVEAFNSSGTASTSVITMTCP